jgi:antitoxin component YwqK of YwqJK toxin-antitoxin module
VKLFFRATSNALIILLLFSGCGHRSGDQSSVLTSINIIDQHGFSETISAKDRLEQYAHTDFLQSQPYKKVMRVYGRDKQGSAHSCLTSYYPNGQPKQYLEAVNGRAHGKYQEWYEEGTLKLQANIIGGKADLDNVAADSWLFDSKSQAWDENGQLTAKMLYHKGQLHGLSTHYHANGSVWKLFPYEKGKLEGAVEIFFPNGDLQMRSHFHLGINEGSSRCFWRADQLAIVEEYVGGVLQSGQYFDQEGRTLGEIINSQGFQVVFAEKGGWEVREIHNGVPKGLVKEIDKHGQIVKEYAVKDDQKHGDEVFYIKGFPRLSMQWHKGMIQGIVKTWYDDGTLESQREMSHNRKNGLSTAWYRDGSLMLIEEYRDDKLLKGEYYQKGLPQPASKVASGRGIVTLFDGEGTFLKKVNYHDGCPDD